MYPLCCAINVNCKYNKLNEINLSNELNRLLNFTSAFTYLPFPLANQMLLINLPTLYVKTICSFVVYAYLYIIKPIYAMCIWLYVYLL